MDGHNSHVTKDVADTTQKIILDVSTIPNHTSHAIQPLDVSIFKPFRMSFKNTKIFGPSGTRGRELQRRTSPMGIVGLEKGHDSRRPRLGFDLASHVGLMVGDEGGGPHHIQGHHTQGLGVISRSYWF